MSELTAGVASRPNEITPPLVGNKFPDLQVIGIDDEGYALSALVAAQPTLLIYYRGNW